MTMSDGVRVYMCSKCNWSDFVETKTCPRCRNEVEETALSGRGRVVTFTVIRYPPEGFEKDAPYVVALVDLENGPRVIGRVTANPEELKIAQVVQYSGKVNDALRFRA